ncbi:hypothetical protein P154DRAFT_343516 [Amniculicola lignicola CBS 123094]|uniref:F-box domain-containing protein n=1 Tax=Amniculicola lignicola CBS 123094 TaxID=1392246 RepID=A0A6A5W632_9PLEO|nr:hypothetical protein P154DRAFT_343516 [Amniculicola lignicola CBS 123094]
MPHIHNLPEELLASIFRELEPIRSFNVDAQGPEENIRRSENKARVRSLKSLCLVSRQYSRIAVPVLYSALILAGTRVHRTNRLAAYSRAALRRPWLRECLLYVEQLHDEPAEPPKGPNWYNIHASRPFDELLRPLVERVHTLRDEFYAWDGRDAQHHSQLALTILMAPNIAHLTIYVTEDVVPYFCDFAGFHVPRNDERLNFHEYAQLETLCLAPAYDDWNTNRDRPCGSISWRNVAKTLQCLPKLKNFQLSGPSFHEDDLPTPVTLANLQTINMHGTNLMIGQLATLAAGCKSLTELYVQWGSWNFSETDLELQHLLNPLLPLKESLEVLSILPGLRSVFSYCESQPMLRLDPFGCLRTLHIIDFLLLGTIPFEYPHSGNEWGCFRPPLRIVQCLPVSLEVLFIIEKHKKLNDNAAVLWDFAEDLPLLPKLSLVYLEIVRKAQDVTKLTARFEEQGVSLSTETDARYFASIRAGRYSRFRQF